MMSEIDLPWPAVELSPNARCHWRVKAEAFKAAKSIAYLETLNAVGHVAGTKDQLQLSLQFYPPDRRKYDADNLLARIKAYIDGFSQALSINDSQFNPIIIRREKPTKGGLVRVYIQRYW